MKVSRPTVIATLALSSLLAFAQERGAWRAASKTARSITGDIAFSTDRVSINFVTFPASQIRALTPAEIAGAFDLDDAAGATGWLYKVDIPASKKFVGKNDLCSGDSTEWIATYLHGKNLDLALFSGKTAPVFTHEAIGNSTNLCGTFSYVR